MSSYRSHIFSNNCFVLPLLLSAVTGVTDSISHLSLICLNTRTHTPVAVMLRTCNCSRVSTQGVCPCFSHILLESGSFPRLLTYPILKIKKNWYRVLRELFFPFFFVLISFQSASHALQLCMMNVKCCMESPRQLLHFLVNRSRDLSPVYDPKL